MLHKKLHRFLIGQIPEGKQISINDDRLNHQLFQVLKLEVGESFILFENGGDDNVVEIKNISKNNVDLDKIKTTKALASHRHLIAAVSIIKGQTFEMIAQKLTELGVAEIVPIITSRTIKQSVRTDRLQTISDEALEQSGGSQRVLIYEPMKLAECLTKFPYKNIAFHQGMSDQSKPDEGKVVMYIGPEGGWSDQDLEVFKPHNIHWKGLTDTMLRTETAAIVGAYEILRK